MSHVELENRQLWCLCDSQIVFRCCLYVGSTFLMLTAGLAALQWSRYKSVPRVLWSPSTVAVLVLQVCKGLE